MTWVKLPATTAKSANSSPFIAGTASTFQPKPSPSLPDRFHHDCWEIPDWPPRNISTTPLSPVPFAYNAFQPGEPTATSGYPSALKSATASPVPNRCPD